MMPKFKQALCAALMSAPLACVSADNDPSAFSQATPSLMPFAPAISEPVLLEHPGIERKPVPMATATTENSLSPFTGKVRGKKVRLRLDADLESNVIRELDKNELLTVVGEKGNFYAVQPPSPTKAYVFRSFVLEDVIEGNRVNIRLEPDMEAHIIGHFNAGDRLSHSTVCNQNSKWLEIDVPSHVHFYVSKDFVENIGGPELKDQVDRRRSSLKQTFENTTNLVKAELQKSFEEIDMERLNRHFDKLTADCAEFPEFAEGLLIARQDLQNAYLQKKLAFLERKAGHDFEDQEIHEETVAFNNTPADQKATDKMLLWQPIEEALYLNWSAMHQDHDLHQYYEEQNVLATSISGILEAYTAPVRNKPGDYILKDKDLPVAYVYSTKINLQDSVGKRVKLKAISRPNNNFAFPAYFVLSEE